MGRFIDILTEVKELKKSGALSKLNSHQLILHEVRDFSPQEIKMIREKTHMSQKTFSICLGVTSKSIEAWEGGRSKPNSSARRLLQLFADNPNFAQDCGILEINYNI